MPVEWASSLASWLAIPTVSFPSIVSALLVDRKNFGLKVLWVRWCLYCSTGVLSGYSSWTLQIPYPQRSVSQLRSPPYHGTYILPPSLCSYSLDQNHRDLQVCRYSYMMDKSNTKSLFTELIYQLNVCVC